MLERAGGGKGGGGVEGWEMGLAQFFCEVLGGKGGGE